MQRVGLLAAVVLVTGCAEPFVRPEKFSAGAEEATDSLRQQIRAELAEPGAPDWAGEYYEGDGTGVNVSVILAPGTGYVFEWHGCMGVYDRNFGDIDLVDGRLRLSFTYENCREGFQGLAPELVPVRWGERRYLIPPDELLDFCNEINQGAEPRHDMHGMFLLRRGDEDKVVHGWPELEPEFRERLLQTPVEATIIARGSTSEHTGLADTEWTEATLFIDAGRRQGLRCGMELLVSEPEGLVQGVRLTQVDEERSKGVAIYDDKWQAPRVGWRLSTRAPWRRRAAGALGSE